jgi:sulfite oxidase
MIVHSQAPLNAETPRSCLLGQCTATSEFFVRNHGPIPAPPVSFAVDGMVERELRLSVADLRAYEPCEAVVTLQCAGNRRAGLMAVRDIPGETPWGPGATSTATWRGVRLSDVLETAGLRDAAAHIELVGAEPADESGEPFGGSIPRAKALDGSVLLAWEMNGAPLTAEHGAPLRAIVPGYIGARSVKWLTRVTALAEPSRNYFQAVAYRLHDAPLGEIAVNADIVAPGDGARVPEGPLEVVGYALAHCGIGRVEVSADGGATWREAELLGEPEPGAWRRWRTVLEARPGRLEVVARAWDGSAATQPADPASVWNPKGYVNNSWARVQVEVG